MYDPAEHGEAVPVELIRFVGGFLWRGFGAGDYRQVLIPGIVPPFDPGGEPQYGSCPASWQSCCPDMRYDDYEDGYALIATEKGVWVRELVPGI